MATGRTDSVASQGAEPAFALNEGFQSGLLVAAGIVVVSVGLNALVSRGSRPAPVAGNAETAAIVAPDHA